MASQNKRRRTWQKVACALAFLCCAAIARASEQAGQVIFNGLPMPGATITATQGDKKVVAISDAEGYYHVKDLADGAWKISVTMLCFAPQEQNVTVGPAEPGIRWDLKMLPLDQVIAQTKEVKAPVLMVQAPAAPVADAKDGKKDTAKGAAPAAPPSESASEANDGFLVNGSVNNAATSQYSLAQAFGNTRSGFRNLYTGNFRVVLDNSAFNARSYSLAGSEVNKVPSGTTTLSAQISGPLNIPHLMPRGPNLYLYYQWSRQNTANTATGLVPTADQRAGILPDGTITNISPQATALLAYYPLPNVANNSVYNYQLPVVSGAHTDAFQISGSKSIGKKGDYVSASYGSQSQRGSNTNLFGFTDSTRTFGVNSGVSWGHRFHGITTTLGYNFSRYHNSAIPYFENRSNVSGLAGINGNNQDPTNWGPPALSFNTITGLSDGNSASNRNETNAVSFVGNWYHSRHYIRFGADYKRQEFNYFQQSNPRGVFSFTGAATGRGDFADFLTGTPDISTLSFGNADKYLRDSLYDAAVQDDWRLRPELTLNIGLRWEYSSPITELKNRLANLDIAPGFTAAAPVLATSPVGSLTGDHLPTSLVRPTMNRIMPRVALAWTPIPGSSVKIGASYGVYSDTSVYGATALALASQSPFSTSLNVQNSAACPLTLAHGFNPCSQTTADTFAVDPNFRVGYSQAWLLSVQRDLPAALQMVATYTGIKGTRGVQEFYPNSYPGTTNPCPQCPVNFVYRTSNGNSTKESGSIQMRRRLRAGFQASATYTYSKAIDDDSVLGGQGPVTPGTGTQNTSSPIAAQNWQNLKAERSRSGFDQRHTLQFTGSYTSGIGLGGGTLLGGWRGRALKEWTFLAIISAGTGMPETPIYGAVLNGAGSATTLRPNRTSEPLYLPQNGRYLNPNAFSAPLPGQYGNAGRYSITGPGTFTFDASMARTFRLDKKRNLTITANAANVLNHPVYSSYNYTLSPVSTALPTFLDSSPQFGAPAGPKGMRTLQLTGVLKF